MLPRAPGDRPSVTQRVARVVVGECSTSRQAVEPLADLQALARAPLDVARNLRAIADAVRILPEIENLIVSLVAALEPALGDVHELRAIVGSQQQQVTHIEEMMQRLDRRTVVLERTVVDLQNKADHAMRLLPDADDDSRTVLEKAKDVIGGA